VEPGITWNKYSFSLYKVSVAYGSGPFCSSAEPGLLVHSTEKYSFPEIAFSS